MHEHRESMDPERIESFCRRLRDRSHELQRVPTMARVEALHQWAAAWRTPGYSFREAAIAAIVQESGFSFSVVEEGLQAAFDVWTRDQMLGLLATELGHRDVLDRFAPTHPALPRRLATAPQLVLHILAGNLFAPTVQSLVAALIVGASSVLKAPSQSPAFAHILVESLDAEPIFRGAVESVAWPRSSQWIAGPLVDFCDYVIAYGDSSLIEQVRGRIPSRRLIERGPKFSYSFITREVQHPNLLPEFAVALVRDLVLFDGVGCLSPQVIFLETGGKMSPAEFCIQVLELGVPENDAKFPLGAIGLAEAAQRMNAREMAAFRGQVFTCGSSTLVLTEENAFLPGSAGRMAWVKPVASIEETAKFLGRFARQMQAVAIAASRERFGPAGHWFSRHGANRICRPGQLQHPSSSWPNDGHGVLSDLLSLSILEP